MEFKLLRRRGSLRLTVTRNYEASSKQLERDLTVVEIDYAVCLPRSHLFPFSFG